MKKVTSMILCIALLLMLAACEKSDDVIVNDLNLGELEHEGISIMGVTYDFYSNGYAFIKAILHENAQISDAVTYEGQKYVVAAIGYIKKTGSDSVLGEGVFGNPYANTKSPDHLILPNSIIYVSSNAFAYSTASTISLPKSLSRLGSGVFKGCRNIKEIELPSTLTYIGGSSLFSGCINLKSVIFPDDCELFSLSGCFLNCHSLTSVKIPGTVKRLGDTVFGNCYELTEVVLDDGIENIGTWTFSSCTKLEKLVIPESVTVIESQVFHDCPALMDLTLPDNLTDIPADLFVNEYGQPADTTGMIIRVRADMVSYVQNIYPAAKVVAK